ncbi:MAG: hypothetical protein JRJ59_00715 [Deltaproteobacteria bacterium]|nr:hypothetical protein [Deltaproteobacteria bacterium]
MTRTQTLDWRWWGLAALLSLALLASGCAKSPTSLNRDLKRAFPQPMAPANTYSLPPEPTVYGEISGPAEELAREVGRWLREDPRLSRVAVTTFVDVNNLEQTTAFGRALTDALISLLHRQGFEVVELRKTNNFVIRRGQGEFYLSRNIAHLADQHDLSAVLVGTYTEALNLVLVSTRLISAQDGQVLSSGLLELFKSRNLSYLLGGPGGSAGSGLAQNLRRAPSIPPAQVPVLERKPKGSAKVRP